MDFLEGSGGVYRPIRVLFDTPIYERALQICWNLSSYKSQIALVMELLYLQQVNQIPSEVTAEEMIDAIQEQSKHTLREHLWEFEMEDFDEEEAKPLLKLVWAVNVCNKMRDVEFEAQLLLESPEAVPSNFKHPRVLRMAKDYTRILRQRQQEALQSRTFSPQEVIIEVVPRVLQGLWVLPRRPLLNMPSKMLSQMSVGVTKAVLDQVSSPLSTSVGHQTNFSRSIRDEIVQSILTEIRQTYPLDTLKSMIKNFAPVLLTEIVNVAVGKICEIFQPQCAEALAHLTPTVEYPASTPVQEDSNLAVSEEQPANSSHTDCAVVSPPSAPAMEQLLINVVQTREELIVESSLDNDPTSIREIVSTEHPAPPMPPVEHLSVTAQAGEDPIEESSLGVDLISIQKFASTFVPHVSAPLSSLAEAVVCTAVQDGLNKYLAETNQQVLCPMLNSAEFSSSLAPPINPAEPAPEIQAGDENHKEPVFKEHPEPIREVDCVVGSASPMSPAEPAPLTEVLARLDVNEESSTETDPASPGKPPSAVVSAFSAPVTPPTETVVSTTMTKQLVAIMQPTSNTVANSAGVSPHSAPLKSITPPDNTDVKDRASLRKDPTPTTAPTFASVPLTAPDQPVVTTTMNSEVKTTRGK